jgi:hypothetical protein
MWLVHVVVLVMVLFMMLTATAFHFFKLLATLARLRAILSVALNGSPQLILSTVPISFTTVIIRARGQR